jgi:Tol biopolymer transport system component/predicted Ser/Thr protein kinase
MIGNTISHYQILEELGKGGMGVVYKARDTHLGRLVAIKILPPERVADADRKRRFVQEAKSASTLNHPHIITIYDVESTDQVCFIAMEYVKGKTMRQLIPPNGMPPGEALKYAVQIADALAALHAKGIVHRDLKPTNVMLGEGAVVKVLDFGLVKLTEWLTGAEEGTPSTMEQTEEGVAVGTPAYMSPEQVEGKHVDARSDIFSFGILLYEMLTGQRPFQGGTKLAVASAILNKEPVPIASINSSTPSEIERTVARCLEKDPQRRFQDAADLKIALEWLARDVESGRLGALKPAIHVASRKRRAILAVALLAAAVVAAAAMIYRQWPKPQATLKLERVTSDLGMTVCPALSLDGKLLAYSSDRSGDGNLDIWVQQIAGGQPIRRTSHPTDEENPNFSPDGSSIVFSRADGGIFIMPTLTGEERQIVPSGLNPRISPDGMQIVYWIGDLDNRAPSGKVYVSTLGRGPPVQMGTEFADARCPIWAPDGRSILFQGVRSPQEDPDWWVVPVKPGPAIDTGILRELRKRGLFPVPGPGDWKGNNLIFSAREGESRHIWTASIDPRRFRLSSPLRQLTFGTGLEGEPSVATNGQMAVSGTYYHDNLWRLSLKAGEGSTRELSRFSKTGAFDTLPSISAASKKMAFVSRRSGSPQIWIRDLDGGNESCLTIGAGVRSAPVIAPDGTLVAYSIIEDGKPSIYVVDTDNSRPGSARRVCDNCGPPSDWTPDLRGILYTAGRPESVHHLDIASGLSTVILKHSEFNLDQPHVSPDGCCIAFVAVISSELARIFLCPLTNAAVPPEHWIAVTDGNSWDDKPRWLDRDSLIYYSTRDHFGCLWKQQLNPGTRQPAGVPSAVHHFHELRLSPRTSYRSDFEIAVEPDFLVLNLAEVSGNIWLTSLTPNP